MMLEEEIQLAIRLVNASDEQRDRIMRRSGRGPRYSGALARDVLESLQGKPNRGRAVGAWISLIKQLAGDRHEYPASPSPQVCRHSQEVCSA